MKPNRCKQRMAEGKVPVGHMIGEFGTRGIAQILDNTDPDGIQRALASFRHETAFPGPIYIGAMSRKSGRRLNPHKSHQSGRDVDVRLPAMPYAKHTQKLQEWEVDWHATWALIRAFAETGDVQQIFLEMKFWRRLRRAAVEMGSADAEIDAIMGKYVRHSRGHVAHIHVRFVCSEAAERCRD